MFYEIVNNLCKERKTTITKMSEDIGLSNAAATSWKKGSIPKSSTLEKISAYFGVSTDYLLGKTDTKKPADQKADGLRGLGYDELTPENQKMIADLIDKLLQSQSGGQ
jgi:transcriptional regulator with XRE-family HTH domain